MSATLQEKEALFLSSPKFAVVGASSDRSRWATKVLQWYVQRGLDVLPVHPRERELEGIPTVPTIADLPHPALTSVSIITVAHFTLKLLQQAKALDVPAVWIQPGAEDDAVEAWIEENGWEDRVIWGGPCILVDGDGVRNGL